MKKLRNILYITFSLLCVLGFAACSEIFTPSNRAEVRVELNGRQLYSARAGAVGIEGGDVIGTGTTGTGAITGNGGETAGTGENKPAEGDNPIGEKEPTEGEGGTSAGNNSKVNLKYEMEISGDIKNTLSDKIEYNQNTTIVISDLKAGNRISISVKIKDDAEEVLYKGKLENVIIQAGENNLSIRLTEANNDEPAPEQPIDEKGSSEIGVSEAIPTFEIIAYNNEKAFTEDETIPYESSKLKFTPSVTLAEYTKLFWTINDNSVYPQEELDSSEPDFIIDLTAINIYLDTNGSNVVKCKAVNGKLMKEASFVLNVETGSVFYINSLNELYDANDFYGKSLGKFVAVAGDNQFYTLVQDDDYNYKIIYFDGNEWDKDSYSCYALDGEVLAMAYDKTTGYLYIETKVTDYVNCEDNCYLNVIDTAVKPTSTTSVPNVLVGKNTYSSPAYSAFAVNDNVLYGTTMYYIDGINKYKCDIKYRTLTVEQLEEGSLKIELGDESDIVNSGNNEGNTYNDILSYFDISNANSQITDFYVSDSNLYYLYKDSKSDLATPSFTFRGFIGKVDISNKTVDSNYRLGWYNGDVTNNYRVDCLYPDPSTTTSDYFFGPYRIINIKKEDEIVIEDYGFYVSGEKRYKYKGRFVTVNLSSMTVSAKDTDIRFGPLPSSDASWEEE